MICIASGCRIKCRLADLFPRNTVEYNYRAFSVSAKMDEVHNRSIYIRRFRPTGSKRNVVFILGSISVIVPCCFPLSRRQQSILEHSQSPLQHHHHIIVIMLFTRFISLAALAALGSCQNTSVPDVPEPPAPGLTFLYTSYAECQNGLYSSQGPRGIRTAIPIIGGNFTGPRLRGQIPPSTTTGKSYHN